VAQIIRETKKGHGRLNPTILPRSNQSR
jgi:hypothetical protein